MATVRACGPDAIDQVIIMGNHWADQFVSTDYDEHSWGQNVRQYSIYAHACWLCFYNNMNEMVGFISGAISAVPHSGIVTSQIHYVYLEEPYLDSDNFMLLHHAFENWARERSAVSIIAPSGYEIPETYQELFDDLGYAPGATVIAKGIV